MLLKHKIWTSEYIRISDSFHPLWWTRAKVKLTSEIIIRKYPTRWWSAQTKLIFVQFLIFRIVSMSASDGAQTRLQKKLKRQTHSWFLIHNPYITSYYVYSTLRLLRSEKKDLKAISHKVHAFEISPRTHTCENSTGPRKFSPATRRERCEFYTVLLLCI